MKQSKNLTTNTLGSAVATMLPSAYEVKAQPRLIADWNYNQYYVPAAVDNIPSDDTNGFDAESFPVSSIAKPLRPTKGIAKARVNEALVSGSYAKADSPKFYVGSPNDIYKYWTSPVPTNSAGNFATPVQPFVIYPQILKANKIVVKFENTWATPNSYNVQVAADYSASPWNNVGGSSPAIDNASGVLTLYYNGTAWVTTRPTTLVTTNVAGIKLVVNSMKGGYDKGGAAVKYTNRQRNTFSTTGANSSLNVIAIEAHLEVDLTSKLISVDDEFDLGDTSQLYPIGTISSNQASVVLDNTDALFSYENSSSPYYGILDENVEFNLEYIYNIGGVFHSIQEFKMYSNTWQADSEAATISVELEDYSKFLKTVIPNRMLYENCTSTQLIWRVLDSVGFSNYNVKVQDPNLDHRIGVFWINGTDSAWEVLDSIAQATQTAIYFDSYGVLQVRMRDAALNSAASPVWHLRGQNNGSQLADISSFSETQNFESNSVDVVYKTTAWKLDDNGNPALSAVWAPDGDLVVRSTPLINTMSSSDMIMQIGQADSWYWPYKSKIEIDGEIIQYEGKFFVYYTGSQGGTQNVAWVKSQDEYEKLNNLSLPAYRHLNGFTGHLQITERGIWNTDAMIHKVDASGWTTKEALQENTAPRQNNNPEGFYYDKTNSRVALSTGPTTHLRVDDILWANHDTASSTGYVMQGTRVMFYYGRANQLAGFGFRQSGASEDGYYVELTPTAKITNRAAKNEITLYSRKNRQWATLHAGVPIPIAEGIFYDVDVNISTSGGQDTISVFVNGLLCAKATTTGATKQPNSGRMSMYTRGSSTMIYEYMYGVAQGAITPESGYGFFDLKYGGLRAGTWTRQQVWQTYVRYRRMYKGHWGKAPYKKNFYFFDEFGPYVHEVREFDVEFDPSPVQYSELYSSNGWYTVPVEYYASPFGAHFTIANVSRDNAILNGDDTLTLAGTNAAITQVCTVLGRTLDILDDQRVTVKNEQSIRRHGIIASELSSDWIQSEAMATEIGNWIVAHWGQGVDELEVEIFGNPLLELGDVVDIDYADKYLTPATHKYFVTAIKNSFSNGITTSLTLRRVR